MQYRKTAYHMFYWLKIAKGIQVENICGYSIGLRQRMERLVTQ
jgi:hypothetical protein